MQLTVRDLRHLAAELRARARALDAVVDDLVDQPGVSYPASARTASLWHALDLDAVLYGGRPLPRTDTDTDATEGKV